MSYDLSGPQGEHWFNNTSWRRLLQIALLHDWEPHGTERPAGWDEDEDLMEEEWEGSYFWNDGQRVTHEDAAGLADALERALPHIPEHDPFDAVEEPVAPAEGGVVVMTERPGEGRKLVALDHEPSVYEWFGGSGKKAVQDFIDFCRQGGFTIW